jgi:hypothetical protein
MVAVTVSLLVFITLTLASVALSTYKVDPLELRVAPQGPLPTPTLAVTVSVVVDMIIRVSEALLVSYRVAPLGLRASVPEVAAEAMVAVTVLLLVLITDTLVEVALAT